MKLTRRHLEPGAMGNYLQISHRRTVIEYAVAGIQRIHNANVELLGDGSFNQEMEGDHEGLGNRNPFTRSIPARISSLGKRLQSLFPVDGEEEWWKPDDEAEGWTTLHRIDP